MEKTMRQIEQELDLLRSDDKRSQPFRVCRGLLGTANELILQHNYLLFGEWMKKVLLLYMASRSGVVRTAIENVLIYGLNSKILHSPARKRFMHLMPEKFRTILRNQIISSGI